MHAHNNKTHITQCLAAVVAWWYQLIIWHGIAHIIYYTFSLFHSTINATNLKRERLQHTSLLRSNKVGKNALLDWALAIPFNANDWVLEGARVSGPLVSAECIVLDG